MQEVFLSQNMFASMYKKTHIMEVVKENIRSGKEV